MKVETLWRSILIVGLAVLLIPAQLALAKGPPSSATIRGPSLNGEVEITDSVIVSGFALAAFENFEGGALDSPQLTQGYLITTYFGKGRPFDHFTYYLDPQGALGYVFYNGIVNGSSEYDGKWYRVTPQGDRAIRRLLAQLGVLTPTHLVRPTAGGARSDVQALVVLGIALTVSGWSFWRDGQRFAHGVKRAKRNAER